MREFKSLRQKCKYIFFVVKTQVKSYILISQNVAFNVGSRCKKDIRYKRGRRTNRKGRTRNAMCVQVRPEFALQKRCLTKSEIFCFKEAFS